MSYWHEVYPSSLLKPYANGVRLLISNGTL